MLINHVQQTLFFLAFLIVSTGCGGSDGPQGPVNVIDLTGDAGVNVGCSQPAFPAEQPDMSPFFPPEFVTDTGDEQRLVRPGQDVLAEVVVNGATRQIFVELKDVWSPQVIAALEVDTTGNQTVPLTFLTNRGVRGRFFLRLTLCGSNCSEREVVFDLIEPDPDAPATTGINGEYERTVIENGEVVRVDETCVRPNSVLIQ